MSINIDPSRTSLLRRKFSASMYNNLHPLKKVIRTYLEFTKDDPVSEAVRVNKFDEWMRTTMKVINDKAITVRPVAEAYGKGLTRGTTDTATERGVSMDVMSEVLRMVGSELSRVNFNDDGGFVRNADESNLQGLIERSIREMEGLTDTMRTEIVRQLSDGVARGLTIEGIARNINRRIDIGIGRARRIARTEVIRAHAEGALDAMERLGVETVSVNVEWTTAGDGKVCELCQPLDGVILTIRQARGLFPRHPNCRCTPVPSSQKASRAKTRRAVAASVKAEQPKSGKMESRSTPWKGPRV